jgi:hypothetical protein
MDLACSFAGIAGAAEVAERQATHTGDVTRYVHDVCTRYDAFRGAIAGLGAVYATAVGSACDGLDRSSRAAQRWGGAARDTADDLADVDALARRVVERLADLFPGLPDDLVPVAPVAPEIGLGACLPSTVPGALAGPGGSPVPLDDVLGLDTDATDVFALDEHPGPDETGAPDDGEEADDGGERGTTPDPTDEPGSTEGSEDDVPRRLGESRPLAQALGAGWDLTDAVDEAVGAVDALGASMAAGADAQDDATTYDRFVAGAGA